MSGLIFKGDVDSLSLRQQEFIEEFLGKRGIKNSAINIEPVGKAGDNYTANVKRIKVQDNKGNVFKMIAKIAPRNEIARISSGVHIVFGNESTMYTEILPKFVELQVATGVPKHELLRFAECYGVLLESPHELILLEDLQMSDFVMLDRFKPLTDKFVRMILKNFAILHSLSLALKKKEPETFSVFKNKTIDRFGYMKDKLVPYAISVEKNALEVLDSEAYKMAVRNTVSKLFDDFEVIFKDQADLYQSVIVQGDGWTNNLMFKLEDDNPVECVMIDYQLSKAANPSCDILYMIFTCTDYETRHKYYHKWIHHYYLELDQSLSNFGMKADLVYPKDQLDADLKKYSKIYFSVAIMLYTILIRKPEKAKSTGEKSGSLSKSLQTTLGDEESLELFKRRLEGLIDSCREFGYIE